ncbi:hypothetical protein NDU88_004916 [Pleurodeles waltl]|uniref:Uncharacterized protein n=1 Tax=Pleurodeles waltl TaxID=8319 RepID=A0AAV7RIP9_PLEWA|nr:hypothetical protein NDU88_004916 [Pleurodeles waltl]
MWRDVGGPADRRTRARKAQGGRADAGARDYVRRCVAGSGAVQDAERAGGRGGPAARSIAAARPRRRHRWAP